MDRAIARAILARQHAAQNAMYAGGDVEPGRSLLSADIDSHVPGHNAIAGTYRGVVADTGLGAARPLSLPGRSERKP